LFVLYVHECGSTNKTYRSRIATLDLSVNPILETSIVTEEFGI